MKEGDMAEDKSRELNERREELTRSLPDLTRERADAYRLNSDALALNRAGVTHQEAPEMARLGEAEVTADMAIRDAQRELRSLDAQIDAAPRRGVVSRLGRVFRRARSDT
jgi:hypothetical protein